MCWWQRLLGRWISNLRTLGFALMGSWGEGSFSGLHMHAWDRATSKENHLSVRWKGSSLRHSRTVNLRFVSPENDCGDYSEGKQMDLCSRLVDGWTAKFQLDRWISFFCTNVAASTFLVNKDIKVLHSRTPLDSPANPGKRLAPILWATEHNIWSQRVCILRNYCIEGCFYASTNMSVFGYSNNSNLTASVL